MPEKMPTTYLSEKLRMLDTSSKWLESFAGWVPTDAGELGWIRHNAQSIVDEIDKWQGEEVPASVVLEGETTYCHRPECPGHTTHATVDS